MRPNLQPKIYKSPVVAQQLLSHVCNYKVQFCAFKGDAQNLPLRRVGRGEISPQQFPEVNRYVISYFYAPFPKGGGGIGVYCFTSVHLSILPSVLPSVQYIFHRIFLSNCWWQKSDIWSQASYRYTILQEAVLDPSDSYFLFADLIGFYTH